MWHACGMRCVRWMLCSAAQEQCGIMQPTYTHITSDARMLYMLYEKEFFVRVNGRQRWRHASSSGTEKHLKSYNHAHLNSASPGPEPWCFDCLQRTLQFAADNAAVTAAAATTTSRTAAQWCAPLNIPYARCTLHTHYTNNYETCQWCMLHAHSASANGIGIQKPNQFCGKF